MKHRWILVVTAVMVAILSPWAWAEDHPQIARGMNVYAEQKCSICHAIAGKGNAKGPLDGIGSRSKADEIREWLTNPAEMAKKAKAERKPPMRSFAKLPKEDLDALVAYLLTLTKK